MTFWYAFKFLPHCDMNPLFTFIINFKILRLSLPWLTPWTRRPKESSSRMLPGSRNLKLRWESILTFSQRLCNKKRLVVILICTSIGVGMLDIYTELLEKKSWLVSDSLYYLTFTCSGLSKFSILFTYFPYPILLVFFFQKSRFFFFFCPF